MRRPFVWVGLLLVLAVVAVSWGNRCNTVALAAEPGPTYAAELARSSESIAWLRARAAAGDSWMAFEQLAEGFTERARLTGAYEDYQAAEIALARAFSIAPAGAGPYLARAGLDFTLHRLPAAEANADSAAQRILLDDRGRAAIIGLHADIALQRGALADARRGYERACKLQDGMTGRARLAQCLWKQGDIAGADSLYRLALAAYHGASARPRAWIHLQLGLMDLGAGALDRALKHYRDADHEMPGWWLVDEHIAEILALQHQTADACEMYEDLVVRTGNPEFMDQLARLASERGDRKSRDRWIARARAAYEARMAIFPEATWGHALDHFIEFGTPAEALAIAEKNWALRPNAEAAASLARARARAVDASRVVAAR